MSESGQFAPWSAGMARYSEDRKTITATMPLRADSGVRLTNVEVVEGTFFVCTFEVIDDE